LEIRRALGGGTGQLRATLAANPLSLMLEIPQMTRFDLHRTGLAALAVLAAPALAACTQDTGVAVHNNPPEVAFVLPSDGSWAYAGVPMEFVATITDDITANDDLVFSWTSTLDGYIAGDEVIEGSTVSMVIEEGLSVGEHEITLQVVDGNGESAEDVVFVEMVQNSAPVVSFIKPQTNQRFTYGDVVNVMGYIQDTEDSENLDLLDIIWEGTVDLTDAALHSDSTGRARFDIYDVPIGSYSLGFEVTDLAGDTATASVSFTVE
jgi:hypothetical protein